MSSHFLYAYPLGVLDTKHKSMIWKVGKHTEGRVCERVLSEFRSATFLNTTPPQDVLIRIVDNAHAAEARVKKALASFRAGSTNKELFFKQTKDSICALLEQEQGVWSSWRKEIRKMVGLTLYQSLRKRAFTQYYVVAGKRTPKSKDERDRVQQLLARHVQVREIMSFEPMRVCLSPPLWYTKEDRAGNQAQKKYNMADFRWDVEHEYVTIESA